MNEFFDLAGFEAAMLGDPPERIPEDKRNRQNENLEGKLAIRRICQRGPVDENCWAFMKYLRKTAGGQVYAADPFVEVYRFRENLYGILSISTDGRADSWVYLLKGTEKAMLIDTGYGLGNLRGLVSELAPGMPLIAVNSHAHADHSSGNAQFDAVYCHEYEVPALQAQDAHMWDHLFEEKTGRGIWADFDRGALIPFRPYEIRGVEDGHVFDLGGGHEVELIFAGGHSPGNACYLDRKGRSLFAGGTVICMSVGVYGPLTGMAHGEYATLPVFRDRLAHLAAKLPEYDSVFSGHFITDVESFSVVHLLEACEEVLRDPRHGYSWREAHPWGYMYYKYVKGVGKLEYTVNAL